jgi:predicted DNA-binding transcriptional regulator YafY
MSRSQRLFNLIDVLRRHRRPVIGTVLAEQTGVSLRTLYRDIQVLRSQGAPIDGEAGIGYVLRPGFLLPPLMFTEDEVEALVLGARWVSRRTDAALGTAARNALAKIESVLPRHLADQIEATNLLVGAAKDSAGDDGVLATIRLAIRNEQKLCIDYRDERGTVTRRTVWPFAIGFFDDVRVVAAWCELRQDYRHFRIERIGSLAPPSIRYPRRRAVLAREWRQRQGMSDG